MKLKVRDTRRVVGGFVDAARGEGLTEAKL